MEHREPPRIAAGDRRFDSAIGAAGGRFRLRTFDPVSNRRRIDPVRAGLLLISALACAATLLYVGSMAASGTVNWLHRQSQYQLAFDQIQLVDDLPVWYRGGKRTFLARVRRSSGQSETISQLEVRPDHLATAFKLDPWVEEVVKVWYAPGRISVDLKFREPVAWVKLVDGQQQIIDGRGRVLPSEDVDTEALGPLLKITGEGLTAPADPRPGVLWKSKGRGGETDEVDERIDAAARLARFLKQECGALGKNVPGALRMVEIVIGDIGDFRKRGLFMLNSEGTEFCWGDAPRAERAGELSAEDKWRILLRWAETTATRALAEEDYWTFSRKKKELTHVCPHRKESHRRGAGGIQ